MVYEKLTEYFEENPFVAKTIFEKSLNAARAREASQKSERAHQKKICKESASLPENWRIVPTGTM